MSLHWDKFTLITGSYEGGSAAGARDFFLCIIQSALDLDTSSFGAEFPVNRVAASTREETREIDLLAAQWNRFVLVRRDVRGKNWGEWGERRLGVEGFNGMRLYAIFIRLIYEYCFLGRLFSFKKLTFRYLITSMLRLILCNCGL